MLEMRNGIIFEFFPCEFFNRTYTTAEIISKLEDKPVEAF